jgi:hypothetical protein
MGDPESHRHEGELAQFGVGSMRRLVITPTTFDGRLPDDLLSAEQFNVDDGCNGEGLAQLNCLLREYLNFFSNELLIA